MPCFSLIGIGIQGYSKNFNSIIAMAAVILMIFASLLLGSAGSILSTYGADPTFIDPTSGLYEYSEMPGFHLTRLAAFIFISMASVIFAIVIILEEGTLGSELVHRVFAASLVILGGLLFALHIGLLIQAVLYLIIFLRVNIPEEWKEEPILDTK
jgi:hypothetical protein